MVQGRDSDAASIGTTAIERDDHHNITVHDLSNAPDLVVTQRVVMSMSFLACFEWFLGLSCSSYMYIQPSRVDVCALRTGKLVYDGSSARM
jgi:hypothetical protein